MPAAKVKMSITISQSLVKILEEYAETAQLSKSALIENAIKRYLKKQLATEAKALSKMEFTDLPTEEEWLAIQPEVNF